MEYYKIEVLAPIERDWVTVSDIIREGKMLVIIPSEKLTADQAKIELRRLKKTFEEFEFRIRPFGWSADND